MTELGPFRIGHRHQAGTGGPAEREALTTATIERKAHS